MNTVYQRYTKEGYQYTGIVSRGSWDKETIVPRANVLKIMGNKVVIVQKTEISNFRGRTDKHTYWVALVKYSEKYLAFKRAERNQHELERRQHALKSFADTCSLEEISFMMNYRMASLMQQKIEGGS